MRMATTYDFTCPEKHSFKAVAKLRARCPTCGKMATRQFQKATESPVTSGVRKVSRSLSGTSHQADTPIDTGSGSPRVTTSKKDVSSKSPIRSDSPVIPSSNKPKIVKQGLVRQTPTVSKNTAPPKKTVGGRKVAAKPPVVASRGPVTRVKAKAGHAPTVKRSPVGSRERKVIEQTTDEPYWHQVKRKFFQ